MFMHERNCIPQVKVFQLWPITSGWCVYINTIMTKPQPKSKAKMITGLVQFVFVITVANCINIYCIYTYQD